MIQNLHAAVPTTISSRFGRLGNIAANLLFPPRCVACQAWGALLCARCAQQVEPMSLPHCHRCGRPQRHPVQECVQCQENAASALRLARIAAAHTHPLREAIHALKYEDTPELAPYLARYLVTAFRSQLRAILPGPIDVVVPVPLHEQRLQERGYNQAQLLAAAFARAEGIPMCADSLRRIRSTATQVGMTANQRQHNVAHAFQATPSVRARSVLLVDDVCTTGATLHACASALAAAGVRSTYALSLATPTLG